MVASLIENALLEMLSVDIARRIRTNDKKIEKFNELFVVIVKL